MRIFGKTLHWPYWLSFKWAYHEIVFRLFNSWTIKEFVQRGKRGWADMDALDIDKHLCEILPGMLEYMRERAVGYPSIIYDSQGQGYPEDSGDVDGRYAVFSSEDEMMLIWTSLLKQMEDSFRTWAELDYGYRDEKDRLHFYTADDPEYVTAKKNLDNALALLHYNFDGLWC